MSLNAVLKRIPSYVSDLRKNFEEVFTRLPTKDFSHEQIYSIALAICYNLKNELMLNNFKFEARIYLEESNITDIRAATIMISRNNMFYRFTSISSDPEIKDAQIDMLEHALTHANIDKITLMMCMLAVSMLNNCQTCVEFYIQKLTKRSIPIDMILEIAKMVSVLKATSEALEIESIRNYEFIPRGENI